MSRTPPPPAANPPQPVPALAVGPPGPAGPAGSPAPGTPGTPGTPGIRALPGVTGGDGLVLPPQLSLTDFIDLATLQHLQDSFTAVTRLGAAIRDAAGKRLTVPSDSPGSVEGFHALDWLVTEGGDLDSASPLAAPIIVGGQQLGSIRIEGHCDTCSSPVARQQLRRLAQALGVAPDRIDELVASAEEACAPNRGAAVQFLYLLANSIARLCYQEYQLRRRVEHFTALYRLSTSLAAQRELQRVLETAARSITEALSAKAALIRLLDDHGTELAPRCAFNLSAAYLGKGPVLLSDSSLYERARAGEVVYIADMTRDPRVTYPEQAAAEGLASALFAGMVYQGQFIGAVQVYSATPRRFTDDELDLMRAAAQLLATAISTARLDLKRQESERAQRQLRLAADVQKRMMPQQLPKLPPFDIAARYIPSLELSGDFYDVIDLHGNLGIALADVAGKGVPASLLMASVRSSLRAFAQDVYDIDEIMARVNVSLSRDTLDTEFATLFYGVLDPKSKRLTYCNAGHEPPLLLRGGKFTRLAVGGMVVGIDPSQRYNRDILDLLPGDLLLLYTDGLCDAQNFSQEKFGRQRIMKAMTDAAELCAADALNHILWEMRRFSGLNRGVDDTTLVVVKYKK